MSEQQKTAKGQAAIPLRLCALTAMSPLHVGADGGFGLVDKPVLRERATGYPLLPGSALKGVLRDSFAPPADAEGRNGGPRTAFDFAFGAAAAGGEDNAGSLIFTDAQLLALPVRSYYGTTAWVSTPHLLERHAAQLARFAGAAMPEPPGLASQEIRLLKDSVLGHGDQVVLEDFDLLPQPETAAMRSWAEWLAERFWPDPGPDGLGQRGQFLRRFALVPELVFDHLCRYGLELRARVKIDPGSRTVAPGHLWYEELLPEGSLLLAYVFCEKVFRRGKDEAPSPAALLDQFCSQSRYLQFGGMASIGRGLCRVGFDDLRAPGAGT